MIKSRFKLDPSQIPTKQHFERWKGVLGKSAKVRSLAAGQWQFLSPFEAYQLDDAEVVVAHVSGFEYQRPEEKRPRPMPSVAVTFCLEGEIVLNYNIDHSVRACRGRVIISNADTQTRIVAEGATRYVVLYLHACNMLSATLLSSTNPAVEVAIPHEMWNWLQTSVEFLRTSLQRNDAVVVESIMKALEVVCDQHARPIFIARGQVDDDRLLSIQAFVDENARNPELGVDLLCQRFHMSRATLYRHMAHLGGVKRYLQLRRLGLCLEELRKGGARDEAYHRSLVKAYQFRSLSDFALRYKNHFGVDPMLLINRQPESVPESEQSTKDGTIFNYALVGADRG